MAIWFKKASRVGLAAMLALFFGIGAVFTSLIAHADTSATLNPTAETYVLSTSSTTNFGAADPSLMSAGSYRTLLKFDTTSLAGTPITSVTLKVFSTVTMSSGGIAVHPELDSWAENTVTWATQPTWNSSVLATSGTPASGTWVSITLPASAVNAGGMTDLGLGYSTSGVIERIAGRTNANAPQLIVNGGGGSPSPSPSASPTPTPSGPPATLTRSPYLTDATGSSMTVNWATLPTSGSGTLTWGPSGGSCSDNSATPTTSSFSVQSTAETMYSAQATGLTPGTNYCYQILSNGSPLLSSPQSFHPMPSGSFSFDVIGDTGDNSSGSSPDQDNLYRQMSQSGADFVLTSGDMAYPGGTQDNYGDLQHTGASISDIFGTNGWPVFGGTVPTLPVLGNHGRNSTFLQNWPEASNVSASNGVYQMVNYPGVQGASTASYPTDYFAFNVGGARFYMLDADWSDSNVGTGSLYSQDAAQHWASSSAEMQWLQADLAAHPGGVKFAVFHFPLHSDNGTETSDTFLQGANSLEGVLSAAGVNFVFNGHAHMYQRSNPIMNMVDYVTGGGGATLEPTGGSGCSSTDAYSIGWSPTHSSGSKCGSATAPSSASQVFHFLKVTVNGNSVTIAPTNSQGQTFDVQTFNVGGSPSPSPSPPPSGSPSPTPDPSPSPSSSPGTVTLNPAAETYVYSGSTTTNFGAANPDLFSASTYRGLLKFDTSSLAGANVASVTLRVFAASSPSSGGVAVHPELDSWSENGVTWANQPTWNTSVLATSAKPVSGQWVSITLPVTAINKGGNTDFGLGFSTSGIIAKIAGRTSANPPQLIVTTQ